jgi:hypothetical protein
MEIHGIIVSLAVKLNSGNQDFCRIDRKRAGRQSLPDILLCHEAQRDIVRFLLVIGTAREKNERQSASQKNFDKRIHNDSLYFRFMIDQFCFVLDAKINHFFVKKIVET